MALVSLTIRGIDVGLLSPSATDRTGAAHSEGQSLNTEHPEGNPPSSLVAKIGEPRMFPHSGWTPQPRRAASSRFRVEGAPYNHRPQIVGMLPD